MKNTDLTSDARMLRNEYARKWRAANKDKVRNANTRYWLKKAKEVKGVHQNGKTFDKC